MADVAGGAGRESAERSEAPSTWGSRLKLVGPGLVVAATGVGAGDMVSSLTAGTEYGTVLIWAIILGAVLKFALTEGLGRWYMATKTTILDGWHSMGWWATGYFIVYLALVTFFFGAAAPSASALAADAMFPGLMPFWAWAVLHSVVFGFLICIIGKYGLFEKVMEAFVGIMFITVVGWRSFSVPTSGSSPWERSSREYRRVRCPTRWRSSGVWAAPSRSSPTRTGCASAAGGGRPGSR